MCISVYVCVFLFYLRRGRGERRWQRGPGPPTRTVFVKAMKKLYLLKLSKPFFKTSFI